MGLDFRVAASRRKLEDVCCDIRKILGGQSSPKGPAVAVNWASFEFVFVRQHESSENDG